METQTLPQGVPGRIIENKTTYHFGKFLPGYTECTLDAKTGEVLSMGRRVLIGRDGKLIVVSRPS